eukprot:TRINITY_DN3470_c0_g1_i1.p1 TRINITY_DN3470_c0_g1~~TRINITY_DN3470_c0_g1_i1.p1  ORF type:complete len:130 (+),score=34.49 TRINITY_DN3470_c0_g1_i1:54-443(+)
MSAWNSVSGNWSWEERNFSDFAMEYVKKALTEQTIIKGAINVTKCNGEATLLFLHGKKRAGYEFQDLTFKFKLADPSFEGTCVCTADSALKDDWEFRVQPAAPDAVKNEIERMVRAIFDGLENEIKNKV